MRYKNAEFLPAELLAQIQEYVSGEYLYIPRKKGDEKSWGEINGSKRRYVLRNREIYEAYYAGKKVTDLVHEYFLSENTIRKIIAIERQK
ncbi:CD3324 family protein [Paenibacillus mendelii]|uniref:CD3324 family protein n=1 Tax=Paenibacillus mendelii TaxID=206163 RepID=A0ABV6JFJ1_9BACL|nr:CD3324 family protein [Paenibacillus mendelii]MCQ6557555.1 CD3324 family protein [Paenibacillus mendelii]